MNNSCNPRNRHHSRRRNRHRDQQADEVAAPKDHLAEALADLATAQAELARAMTESQNRLVEAGTNDEFVAPSPKGSEVVDEVVGKLVAGQHEENEATELSLNDEIKALKQAIPERGCGPAKE